MNLVVDFGNTRIKAALFKERELLHLSVYENINEAISDDAFITKAEKCIIGSVTTDHQQFLHALPKHIKAIEFLATTKVPLKNAYKSALTLGSDRMAAAVGAFSIYPAQNVLVIDAGTCLKFNFITSSGEYLGGAISPGLQMRFKAMNHFTDKLPLVNMDENFNKLIGQSTEESILSGAMNGIVAETDGIIDDYKKQFPDLTVVLTGGDTAFFAKRLKNRIFTHPELVLIGLNEILIYNS